MSKAKTKKPAVKKPVVNKPTGTNPLLVEILAAPDDPGPRMVYADALIEAGDPRGMFIAQQAELDALDVLDDRYAAILASTRRLIGAHGKAWIGEYAKRTKLVAGPHGAYDVDRLLNARFEDGFLRRIAMRPDDIEREWPTLRAREPIRGIELLVDEHIRPEHRAMPQARDFEVLKVTPSSWFTAASVGNVLAWGMPRLRTLDLSGCDLGAAPELLANGETDLGRTFDDFVTPPPFPHGQLRELVLENTQLRDAGALAIFGAAHLENLTTLDLTRCRIADPETLDALRAAPAMQRLVRLALGGNNLLGEHLGRLAGWEVVARLEALFLPQSTTPGALATLFPRPSPTLRTLELASAKELGPAPGLVDVAEALVHLDIGTTAMGDERFAAVVVAPAMRRLLSLAANGCSLSDAAIDELVSSPLERLVTLDLSSNKLTDAGLRTLAGWSGLEHVTHLRIGNNRKVTSAGLASLLDAAHLHPAALDIGKQSDGKIVARLRERFGDALLVRG
ncbi:MAG: TIGR02996 domain-containing protein [Kofleriaceae bacterium]